MTLPFCYLGSTLMPKVSRPIYNYFPSRESNLEADCDTKLPSLLDLNAQIQ